MDEKFFAAITAELIEAQGIALGLLTTAIASQLDAKRLAEDIGTRIRAAKNQPAFAGAAERIATHARDAALAVAQQQHPAKH